jgi:hypothetical protein
MLVPCSICNATGQEQHGGLDEAFCYLCMGRKYLDPERICRCGRPGLFQSKDLTWFCGRISCNPDAKRVHAC